MIKVLLCDADGVTITPPSFGSAYALERVGLDANILKLFFQNEFNACKQGKADLKYEIKPYLDKVGWQKSVDEFLHTWFEYENVVDERLFEEIEKLRKQGVFCALTTDQEKYRKEYVLYNMKFKEKFDTYYISSDLHISKGQQDFFEYVFRDISEQIVHVKKDEVLMIDDTEDVIHTAKQYGFHAELYTNFDDFGRIKHDYKFQI